MTPNDGPRIEVGVALETAHTDCLGTIIQTCMSTVSKTLRCEEMLKERDREIKSYVQREADRLTEKRYQLIKKCTGHILLVN